MPPKRIEIPSVQAATRYALDRPIRKGHPLHSLGNRIWAAADQFSTDYGPSFNRFAEVRLTAQRVRPEVVGAPTGYHDDPHVATDWFDFVLVNSPFNFDVMNKEQVNASVSPGPRSLFGLPRTDNADPRWRQRLHFPVEDNAHA